jgi:branched-chain amino acid transport system substrate-binding protein
MTGSAGAAFAARRWLFAIFLTMLGALAPTWAAEPVRIGFSMALTGGLAGNGKQVLAGIELWREDINAKGGLLGRPVELVYYDDQSNPANVPAIYSKLIDVDKVDLVLGPYATNMVAPALTVIMQHNMVDISVTALAVNSSFHYPRYFSMISAGPTPKVAYSRGFFALAAAQQPKPRTVAIVAADAEFAKNASDGARENAKANGFTVVYDRTYPPSTVDFTPVVRGIQAAAPDIVFVAAYPPDTAGMIRAANELGLKAKLFGGPMVGLGSAALKAQLGPLLNGIVTNELWLPVSKLDFPGVAELLKKYQARATSLGTDPLGYTFPVFAYAAAQALGEAVNGSGSLDPDKIAQWLHGNRIITVAGAFNFGPDGEWDQERVLWTQFQGLTDNSVEQFRGGNREVVIWPAEYQAGTLVYPYDEARK